MKLKNLLHPVKYVEEESEAFRTERAEQHMDVMRPFVARIIQERKIKKYADFGCGQAHITDGIARQVLEAYPASICYAVDKKATPEKRFLGDMTYFREDIFKTRIPDDSLDFLVYNYMIQTRWTEEGQVELIELAKKKLQIGGYLLISEIVRWENTKRNLIGHAKHVLYNGPLVAYNIRPLFYYEGLLRKQGFSIRAVDYLGDGVIILARLERR